MPLIRKLMQVGKSKAIAIPKDWLRYYEKVYGEPIREVGVEVNKVLKIFPIVEKQAKGRKQNHEG